MSTMEKDNHREVIVADDLTGACDSAVHFAERGAVTEVVLRWWDLPDRKAVVSAMTTETRSISPGEAAARVWTVSQAARRQDPEARIIKKVDSLMRGNIRDELAAMRSALSPEMIILTPAIPRLGRHVIGGAVHAGCGEPIPIGVRLQGLKFLYLGLGSPVSVREGIRSAMSARADVLVADADTDEDLRQLVDAGKEFKDLLWAGAGGLMEALAGKRYDRLATPDPTPQLPLLICAGSDHAVSRSQLDFLRRNSDLEFFEASDSAFGPLNNCLGGGRSAVLIFAMPQLSLYALQSFANDIDLAACGALMLTGGDTAAVILRVLETERIEPRGQILPGVPWGKLVGGAYSGLAVITKSGAFGGPDCFLKCIELCAKSRIYPE